MNGKQVKYKDCIITVFEKSTKVRNRDLFKHHVIRVHDKFGFRWFRTVGIDSLILKIKEAWHLNQKIVSGELCGFNYDINTSI